MSLKKALQVAQENVAFSFLLMISSIAGLKDFFGLIIPSGNGVYFVWLALFATVIYTIRRNSKIAKWPALPVSAKLFDPFRDASQNAVRRDALPRKGLVGELKELVFVSANKHIIVTGQSGAGKTTMVTELLQAAVAPNYKIVDFRNYQEFHSQFLTRANARSTEHVREKVLIEKFSAFLQNNRCSVRDAFDPAYDLSLFESLWKDLARHVEDVVDNSPDTVYVFDQIERVIHLIRNDLRQGNAEINGYEVLLFLKLVGTLRRIKTVRTVFVIRAEYLYQSLDFLESEPTGPTISRGDNVTYFLCPGINSDTDPEAINKIRSNLNTIEGMNFSINDFEHVTQIDSRAFSNSFMLQLCGYVVEHYFEADPRVKKLLHDRQDRFYALRYYLDYLINDFARENGSGENIHFLKAVMFALAVENKATSQAASVDRLAALAHLPTDEVEEYIKFLQSKGLVKSDPAKLQRTYRFVHEVVADFIIEDEQFSTSPHYRDGIRGLSEAHARQGKLTRLSRFPNLVLDWFADWNVALLLIWLFYIFGALKILFAQTCQVVWPLFRMIPQSVSCELDNKLYLPVYATHCVWLMFIYIVSRGTFLNIFPVGRFRLAAQSLPIIGVVSAFLLSQSPALLTLPVVFVGFVMGWSLVLASWLGRVKGWFAVNCFKWGARTLLNMGFAMILSFLAVLTFSKHPVAIEFFKMVASTEVMQLLFGADAGPDDVAVATIYIVSLLMIYFWWHIAPEQQSRTAIASSLTQHDRSRTEAL